MTGFINFQQLLSMAIIDSLVTGCASYIILLLVLWLFRSFASIFKYHLSNLCLLLVFVAFLWPFHKLLQQKDNITNTEQATPFRPVDNKQAVSGTSIPIATKQVVPVPVAAANAPIPVPQETNSVKAKFLDLVVLKMEAWSNMIFALYILGLLFFSLRLSIAYLYSLDLKKNGIISADENWQNGLKYAIEKLNIKRQVSIFFSTKAISPCIIGYSKAVILIPLALSTRLSTEQAEAILLHELAHLKNYDYYINIGLQILNCLLFFNPFSWLIIKKCKQYREQSCDEITVRENRNIALAESLAFIAENSNSNSLALMLKESKHKLLSRIQNLLDKNNRPKFSIPRR